MDELIGRTLGPYQIVQPLGQGGMASVYKAFQPALQRYVAIKILPSHLAQNPQFSERFTREARAVARLDHPNILQVYDFGQTEGITYIVMKYVEGGTLKDLIERGRMAFDQTALILSQVASALDYAHAQGIVHRDVKPANILLARPDWALLSDFGLAKVAEATIQLTGTGVGMGTPEYMAPEQAHGLEVDARADTYALGVTLYAMVTGQAPYTGSTPIEVILKHVNDPLPSARAIVPNLPPAAEAAILKAMAKKPEDRPQSATELSQAFSRGLTQGAGGGETRLESATMPPAVSAPPPPVYRGGATVLESNQYPQQATMPPPPIAPPMARPVSPASGLPTPAQARGGGTPWLWIGLGVVLLVVCGGLLLGGAALGGIMAFGQPTATPTDTPRPPTPTTPPETPTSPAPPTAPPQPTTPPQPTQGGLALFQDDFSNHNSGWDSYSGDNATAAYGDGDYVLKLLKTSWFAWANPETASVSVSNVHIKVTARSTGPGAAPGFGIMCDYQDGDNNYYMGVTTDGYYIIAKYVGGTTQVLSNTDSWITSNAIPVEAASYRVGADCGNGTLTLSVNGNTVGSVTDSSYSSGQIGVFAQSFDQPNVEIHFDDFVVTPLQ